MKVFCTVLFLLSFLAKFRSFILCRVIFYVFRPNSFNYGIVFKVIAIIILYGSTFYNVKPHYFHYIVKSIYTFTIGSLARGLYSHLYNKYDLVFQFGTI